MCVACRIQGRGAPSLRMAPCLVYLWYGCSAVWCWSDSSHCRLLLLPFLFFLSRSFWNLSLALYNYLMTSFAVSLSSVVGWAIREPCQLKLSPSVRELISLHCFFSFHYFLLLFSLFSCCESHIGHSRKIYFPYFSPIFSTAVISLLFYVRFLQYYLAAL